MVFDTTSTFPFRNTAAGYINWFNAGTETQGANGKLYNVYQVLVPMASDSNSPKRKQPHLVNLQAMASPTVLQLVFVNSSLNTVLSLV